MIIGLKSDLELSRFPDWRYTLASSTNPKLIHFFRRREKFQTKEKVTGRYLYRHMRDIKGLKYHFSKPFTVQFKQILRSLSGENFRFCHTLHKKYLRKSNRRKIFFPNVEKADVGDQDIRIHKIDRLGDRDVIRLFKHQSGVEFDRDIADAIRLKRNEQLTEIFNTIGFMLYLNKSHMEIAAKWQIRPRVIFFISRLFFDFSRLPKDPVALHTYLRQYFEIRNNDKTQFNLYKLINELGETGLLAMSNFSALDPEDKLKIEQYLGSSLFETTLKLKATITTREDAHNYSKAINDLASTLMKREEIRVIKSKAENLDAQTKRINIGVDRDTGAYTIDSSIAELNGMLTELSHVEKKGQKIRARSEIELPSE